MTSAAHLPYEPHIRLLDLARELRRTFEDRDGLRREIASYLRTPASVPRLAALGRALQIDPSDFRELLSNADLLLAVAWGDAAEMHGRRIPAPLTLTADIADHLEAGAFATAVVEGNSAGELRDGLIRFNKKELAALSLRLEGGVDLRGGIDRERGSITRAASLRPSAWLEVENVALVPRGEPALEAIDAAIGGFIFPWEIPSRFRAQAARSPLERRIVRLSGARSISISGRFRWGRAFFSPASDEESPVGLRVGAAAGARFSAKLEGDFQIIIEPRGARRATVSVSRRRSSDHRFRASATASLGLDGAELVARAALERISVDAAALLASIEETPERWTDLRALFHAAAEERVDRFLADEPSLAQLEAWLRSIAVRVELRRRLRRIAADLLGEIAASAIDRIDEEIAPAVEIARALIVPLHRALSRLRASIDAAARSRIEIELALSRDRTAASEVAFAFDIDPVDAEAPFLEMLRGDFALAFRMAESGSAAVRLVGGTFARSGTLEIESSLTIAAFGVELGASSLLTQEWDAEVSATGEVLIGVRTSLESERRRWKALRAARVLVESAFLTTVDGGERPGARDGDDLLTLETEIELEPSEEELHDLERRLVALGALDGHTSMSRDLIVERKRLSRYPFGRIEAVAVLRLGWNDLQAIAATAPERARTTFARHLLRWAPPPAIPAIVSRDGLPLFAWPSVLQWAADEWPYSARAIRFHDRAADLHADVPPGHPARALHLYARTVLFFGRALLQLRAMNAPPGDFENVEQMTQLLRREHRTLLRELGLVVGFVDSAIGEVLFTTLLELLPPDHQAETYLVVRRDDGRRFVYQ